MPVTFICFIVAAAAISGVPPLNGFFSKELVYDGALERHWIFYAAALLGSFLTAASFLKLGHAAFLGPLREENKNVKEAPWQMLIPMITIASFCVLFGVYNVLPLEKLIQPILGTARLEGRSFGGFHVNIFLVSGTLVALTLALINHLIGVKRSGSGLGASDHIHHAPVLGGIYDKAEKRWFDPYDLGLKLVDVIANIAYYTDRFINWLSDGLTVGLAYFASFISRNMSGASYSSFIIWSLFGAAAVVVVLLV
jgi:NADH:ubiquinone oxidoreductase subunit 5 (subunit L)/multisubunit Na+/H+ antiporter MnhA subunit